jgi:hypothetical protein
MKKISVIYVGQWNAWDFVWELLDQAKRAGITYTAYDYFTTTILEMKESEDCDGYVYLDIFPTDQSKPFTWIFEDDTQDAIVKKIQVFAGHLKEGYIQKILPKEEVIPDGDEVISDCHVGSSNHIYDSVVASVAAGEVFKGVVIEVDGKEITLTSTDIYNLSKLHGMMEQFDYKIKKLIV